jgi:serine/alanine adding enzyme
VKSGIAVDLGRIVTSLDEDRWTSFVERHPAASIFHTPEMHRVFQATDRHVPAVWAELDEVGEIRALMTTVAIAALGGPLAPLSTRTVLFAAPIAVPGRAGRDALRRVLAAYRARSPRASLFTEVRHVCPPGELSPLLAAEGFRHEPHLNFMVDVASPTEELWGRIASSAQRNIRKARRLGVTIDDASDAGALVGYEVLRDVYHRIQVPLPHRSLFDAAERILRPLGRYRMLLARAEGRTIGVLTLLQFRGVITYWYVGTLREDAKMRAGDLLVWHAIETGRELGAETMDFGGGGRPDEPYGVRDFKAKFGGELVSYGRDVWVRSPARFKATTAGYELLRRFL